MEVFVTQVRNGEQGEKKKGVVKKKHWEIKLLRSAIRITKRRRKDG